MSKNITAETLANNTVLHSGAFETAIDKLVEDGCCIHNFSIRAWPKLREEILACDWSDWFSLTSECREYGGVMIFDAHYTPMNPVMTVGTYGSIELTNYCSGNTYAITVHSHGDCICPDSARPSRCDWYAAAGRGWHIVVCYWGIFAHFAGGKQRGIVKWSEQALKFIPRSEIDGSKIGADLQWDENEFEFAHAS